MRLLLFNTFHKKLKSTKLVDIEHPDKEYEVYLKVKTDYSNPTFEIYDDVVTMPVYTYAYLADIQRFYFVRTVQQRNAKCWEIDCKVDPYATLRGPILNSTAFVERCADSRYYNVDIPDSALSVEDMIEYSDSASTYCRISTNLMYIIRIVGRGDTGGVGTFVTTLSEFQNIFGSIWGELDDDPSIGDLASLVQIALSNPAQYIIGVYSSPIGYSVYGECTSVVDLYVGGHATDVQISKITTPNTYLARDMALNMPTSQYSDFRKTDNAFSQYTIYIPTVGAVALSADLMDTTLTMDIGADLLSGDLLFALKSGGDVVATYRSNCYASLSVGNVNEAGSMLSGSIQTAVGLASGNVGAVIEGIQKGMQPTPSIVGSQGGTGCTTLSNEIVITCQQKSSAEFPTAVYGRPCCKNVLLSNLSGYVKCQNFELDAVATSDLIEEVNAGLNSGIYIE